MKIYTDLSQIPKQESSSIAIGLFDGLHVGHKAVIEEALKYADENSCNPAVVTFKITAQSHPESKEANQQITSFSLFLEQLANMGVKTVFAPTFEQIREYSPEYFVTNILMKQLGARFVACGEDFRFGKKAAGTATYLKNFGEENGIIVKTLPLLKNNEQIISSTEIRDAIIAGDIKNANRMLGHLYAIDFEVVHGNKIGRTIGTPTINQPYPFGYVTPKFGVYATLTYLNQNIYSSITNVGVKPTVGSDKILAETYIQDFAGDLYGQRVQVAFLDFLREETKFSSIDELRKQIIIDNEKGKNICQDYIFAEKGGL